MYNSNTNLGSIGALNTSSQVDAATHNRRKFFGLLVVSRGAFLGLLRLNVWGFATLLSKKAFLVDKATTDSQTMGNFWWDVQARWRNAWYNQGGDWQKFTSAVNAGKGKKFLALKLAPKNIKDKFASQGISVINGIGSQGIGATVEATIIAATELIITLTPIIMPLLNNIKKDVPIDDYDYGTGAGASTEAGTGEKMGMMGAGLVGVGILAALYFGTKKK